MPDSAPQPPLPRLPTLALAYPKAALAILLGIVAAFALGLSGLREEEDILSFLPQNDPDVMTFRQVAGRFGALRVALIGVEPEGADLFSPEVLGRLDRLSGALKNIEGVDRVVSLSTMTDLEPGSGSVEVRPLVPSPIPTEPAAMERLRARALALPQVRGNIVSPDGKAALVLLFLAEGASTRRVAERARTLARAELPGARLSFGGAPFAGQSIYDGTRVDVRRLTPLALLLFFVVVLFSFRDWLAVLLTVGTVGVSGLIVVGGMGLFGEPFTVVTAMLPVILFAAGSQYAIHILGRYYLLRVKNEPLESAEGALRIAGPPVTIAAAATALGFLSFLVMNIGPMRSFGLACAGGIFVCWVLAVTVLPATVVAWPRPYEKHRQLLWLEDRLEGLWDAVQRNRWPILFLGLMLLAVSARYAARVTVRMEPRAFFRPGSEPALAQEFLDTRFGGSQFLQIAVDGDITHPASLREIRRLASFALAQPGVTQVQSLLDPLSLVGEAMGTGRGLPPERKQIGNLLFFIEGEPAVRQLLTQDRQSALLQVRVSGDPRGPLGSLEGYLRHRFPLKPRAHTEAELREELGLLIPPKERSLRAEPLAAALGSARRRAAAARAEIAELRRKAEAPDAPPPGEGPDPEEEVRRAALAAMGAEVLGALGGPEALPGERRAAADLVLQEILDPVPPGEPQPTQGLSANVSGEPVLDRGFSRAVEQNQWASLRVALIGVFLVLLLSLRSAFAAVVCMLPAGLALAVVFGGLGLTGRPMDIGTSLVGSIVTGSGADFAMHYMWYLQRNKPREVARNVGPVILITAVLLAAGLGVNALGNSPPIRLFGWLAAGGLCLSAAFTFLLVPALLQRVPEEGQDF